jgi:hypothetical protein
VNVTSQPGGTKLKRKIWGWVLHMSSKEIRKDDIVSILHGSLKPTIIRLCKDYFTLIVVAVTVLDTYKVYESGEEENSSQMAGRAGSMKRALRRKMSDDEAQRRQRDVPFLGD